MRRLRSVLVAVLTGLIPLLSCVDGTQVAGPGDALLTASLALMPVFPADAQGIEAAPVNVIRLTARRLPENVQVAQVVLSVDPDAEQWDVGIDIPLTNSPGTQYVLEIELVNQTNGVETVQWSGRTSPMTLTPGAALQAREVGVSRGPLDNLSVTSLVVEGPSQVPEQQPFTLTASVVTSQAGSSPAVFWTSLDPEIASIDSDGEGLGLRAGTARIQAQAGPVTTVHPILVTPVPSAVVVTPSSVELTDAGAVAEISATVLDLSEEPIPGAEVSWTVSDERIVDALGGGSFRAVGAGSTTVTATSVADPTLSASATITVRLTPVAVVVEPSSATLTQPGESVSLSAQVLAAGGVPVFDVGVAWSSSDVGVATVDSDGLVTAVSAGTATITATTSPDGALSGSATVEVVLPPASVEVIPSSATLTSVGQQEALQAVVRDVLGAPIEGVTPAWSSSDPGVATVDASGVVTAVSDGTTEITASAGGAAGTSAITVDIAVASVTLTPSSVTLNALGSEEAFTATALDATGAAIPGATFAWSSSDPNVATVSGAGVVTAVGDGTTVITATRKGVSGTATVTVDVAVGSVVVTPASFTLTRVGQQQALSASVMDAGGAVVAGAPVTWASSNTGVATVSDAGVVTAVGDGSATITATSKGASGTAAATVDLTVVEVVVDPAEATLTVGATLQLGATALDEDGEPVATTINWSSSDLLVASVSSGGLVTANEFGTAVITATAKGVSATATITVEGGGALVDAFYETPGNTELVTGGFVRPATAHYYDMANAVYATPGATLTSIGPLATSAGGEVVMEPDGDFSYMPPVGFTGTDEFEITATGGATATVQIEVIGMIWYIGYGGDGNGQSNNWLPGVGGGPVGAPGDILYVYAEEEGIPVEGGIVLQDGQKLLGEGVGLTVSPWGELHPFGVAPELKAVDGPGVTLASNVYVAGLDIVETAAEGMIGNGVTNVTVEGVRILNVGDDGVALYDPTGPINFGDFLINGTGYYGFLVSGGDAFVDVNLQGSVGIQAPSRHIVRVENTTGGSVTFNGGDILSENQRGVKVLNNAGDVYVNSPVTVTNPANDALSVQNSTGLVYVAELNATVTGRSGIHLLNNSGLTQVGDGTLVTTDAPGLDIVDAVVDLNLTSVTVGSFDAGNGLHLENVTGTTSIGLLQIVHEDTGYPIWLQNAGSFEVFNPSSTILANSDDGLHLYGTEVNLNFASVDVDGTFTPGIDLSDITGSVSIAGGSVANTSDAAVRFVDSDADFHFGGDITNPGGQAVYVQNVTGSEVQFTGMVSSTGMGVHLFGNPGTTFAFHGIDLQTGINNAFFADDAAQLEILGTSNVIATTGGMGLYIEDMDIGPSHVTLQSLSVDGPSTGVYVANTGTTGSLKVTGTGSPASGGTIQNTSGNAMYLANTAGVELSHMVFQNTGGHGITGGPVDGFTFDDIQIVGAGGRGITFTDATGPGFITGSSITGSAFGSRITASTGPLVLEVHNTEFSSTLGPVVDGALQLEVSGSGSLDATLTAVTASLNAGRGVRLTTSDGAGATLDMDGGTFASNVGDHVSVHAAMTSSVDVAVHDGATFNGGSNGGVILSAEGSANVRAEVADNDFTSLSGDAIGAEPIGSSVIDLRAFYNTISGSSSGAGVWGVADGASTLRAWVQANSVSGTNSAGIALQAGSTGGSTATGSFLVSDNVVDFNGFYPPIALDQAQSAAMCVSVTGNTTTKVGGGAQGIDVGQQAGATQNLLMERLNGGVGTVTDEGVVVNFLAAENPDANETSTAIITGIDGVASGTCALPVAPMGASPAPPVAHPQEVVTDGSTPVVITLTGADADGGSLTFGVVSPPSTGSLGGITPLGPTSAQVTYTPGGVGTDPFLVEVSDGDGGTGQAWVKVDNVIALVDVAYTTAGNTELFAGGYPAPFRPHVEDLTNVFDPTPGLTADNTGSLPTTQGGQVMLLSSGAFWYRPPTGFNGDDTFEIQSGGETATVTITVTGMVWYVDNTADGSGLSWSPYPGLYDASLAADDGETIFVLVGDGTSSMYDSGITLAPGQRLLGEAAGLTIPGVGEIVAPGGGQPIIDNSEGSTVRIGGDAPGNNVIAGLHIKGGGGPAIRGIDLGTTSVDAVTITDADWGIDLGGATGTLTVTNGTIDVAFGTAVRVQGGSPVLTYDGEITSHSVFLDVDNTTGGSLDFSGGPFVVAAGDGIAIDTAASNVALSTLDVLPGSLSGIRIAGSTGTYTFNDVDMDGVVGRPVDVTGGSPVVEIDVRPESITNSGDHVLSVEGTTGGSVTLTGGSITDTGAGILVANNAGSVSVANAVSITSGTGGLYLSAADGPVTFSDLNVVTTLGAPGISHTGGAGLLTVAAGTVNTTDGAGLYIGNAPVDLTLSSVTVVSDNGDENLIYVANSPSSSVAIGTLTLDSPLGNTPIRLFDAGYFEVGTGTVASASAPAIDIESTSLDVNLTNLTTTPSYGTAVEIQSSSGPFTVAGGLITNVATGAVSLLNNSGLDFVFDGTITNSSGPAVKAFGNSHEVGAFNFGGTITDTGEGIQLTANYPGMTINFNGNLDISGYDFPALIATGGNVLNVLGAANSLSSANTAAILLSDMRGTSNLQNIVGSSGSSAVLAVTQSLNNASVIVTDGTFTGNLSSPAVAATTTASGVLNLTLNGNTVTGALNHPGLIASAATTSELNLMVEGVSVFDGNDVGINMLAANASTLRFDIDGAQILNSGTSGVVVQSASTGGTAEGFVRNSTIDEYGQDGVIVRTLGGGVATVEVSNNTVGTSEMSTQGIAGRSGTGSGDTGDLHMTVLNNAVAAAQYGYGVDLQAHGTAAMCLNVQGNAVTDPSGYGYFGIGAWQAESSTVQLERFLGTATVEAEVEGHLATENPSIDPFGGGGYGPTKIFIDEGGSGFAGVPTSTCRVPTP